MKTSEQDTHSVPFIGENLQSAYIKGISFQATGFRYGEEYAVYPHSI